MPGACDGARFQFGLVYRRHESKGRSGCWEDQKKKKKVLRRGQAGVSSRGWLAYMGPSSRSIHRVRSCSLAGSSNPSSAIVTQSP